MLCIPVILSSLMLSLIMSDKDLHEMCGDISVITEDGFTLFGVICTVCNDLFELLLLV